MKVLFLVSGLNRASCRYRVTQYLPWLEQAGLVCEMRTIGNGLTHRFSLLHSARQADVVFVQKKLLAPFDLLLFRAFARRLIYDFDDAVMFRGSNADRQNSFGRRLRFALMMKHADLIIAGNRYLKDHALSYNQNVRVLPTPVDMVRYTPKQTSSAANSQDVVLGWIGSRKTLPYLQAIGGVLDEVAKACPSVKLKIVADRFFDLKTMPVIKKPWSHEGEIEDLQSFDIGLMPLTDDAWSRGKCGFKLLQYMAVGVPVICSPVGINKQIVTPGVQGFWAATQGEWVASIISLVSDRQLRIRLGKSARERVLQDYSLARNVPLLIEYLQQWK